MIESREIAAASPPFYHRLQFVQRKHPNIAFSLREDSFTQFSAIAPRKAETVTVDTPKGAFELGDD
jgi:hypothetical protein